MHWKYREGGQKAIFLLALITVVFLISFCPAGMLIQKVYGQLFPTATFCMDTLAYGNNSVTTEGRVMDMISKELPLYSYSISYFGDGMMNQYYKEYVEILMKEAEEGEILDPTEEMEKIPEGENTAGDENILSGEESGISENETSDETVPDEAEEMAEETEGTEQRLNDEDSYFTITDGSVDENSYRELIHSEKVQEISLEDYEEFEALVGKFYTVDASTYTTAQELNAKKLANTDLKIAKGGDGPQILIYHTHAHEGYADSTEGDESATVVGVGEKLAEILRNEYGYQVLHHTGKYDENRDYAYSYALPAIEQVLNENPSIEVVIDLHRDSVAEGTRLVTDIEGQPTAKFMFFNGLSRVRELGEISYLPNENLQGNLAFSFQMQKVCEEYYPGLTRKIYLKGYRYNMHLKPRTLLVELGAQNSTLQEAMNACGPLARVLDMVLSGE
ncbi:MAG: stage II sporulation protein P [Lachnospiraceae bacterium]|nr:stage II sporulation protein P [Lachnospiraceae bacterium]